MSEIRLIHLGLVGVSIVPSLFCFGAATLLLASEVDNGWGWLMLIGLIGFELPKHALRAVQPRRIPATYDVYGKPEPLCEEYA